MFLTASIASDFATGVGLLAGMIAVIGFVAQAGPVLSGASERKIRQAVVAGGLTGMFLGGLVILLSAILSRLNG